MAQPAVGRILLWLLNGMFHPPQMVPRTHFGQGQEPRENSQGRQDRAAACPAAAAVLKKSKGQGMKTCLDEEGEARSCEALEFPEEDRGVHLVCRTPVHVDDHVLAFNV
jgi:hypothetical protein